MKDWRLKELSKHIKKAEVVADIGTDHAYLPIYLSKNNLCKKIYASDNKQGPLNQAKENISKEKITNINLLLGDGLKPYDDIAISSFIICGIGGYNISIILDDLKNNEKLILEPRNNFYILRKKLKEMNYKIIEENFIINNNKIHYLYNLKILYYFVLLILDL